MIFRYRVGPWTLESFLPLSWLPEDAGANPPDLVLAEGEVADPEEAPRGVTVLVKTYADCDLLALPGLGRLRISGGNRITVDAPRAAHAELQPFLLGAGLSRLAQQRGLVSLRGCAASKDGAAVLVLGPSAAGKSTLAAALLQRGYSLLSDDGVLFDPGTGLVLPTHSRLKLWPDALDALNIPPGFVTRMRPGTEKRILPAAAFDREPRPPRAVFLLSSHSSLERPDRERVSGKTALMALLTHVDAPRLARQGPAAARNFSGCARLGKSAPVHVLRRTTRLSDLGTLADAVERA
jgi:hypothetical protein